MEIFKTNPGEVGYHTDKITPNIWTHDTRGSKFCLRVDGFGLKDFSKEDVNHMIIALTKHYEITIDEKKVEISLD